MRIENYRSLSVGFISLGCPKNLVDSEVIATDLWRSGFKLAGVPEKSDVLIVNTCAFIRDAEKEAIAAILEASERKRSGDLKLLVVAGCLSQRYQQELRSLLPEVDAFIGVDQIKGVSSIVRRLLRGERGIAEISRRPQSIIQPPADRILFTETPYAYLKIADGCDHRCSFCAIPQIRGKYRSRSMASIVKEAEALLSRGVRELNLIAQDVTYYGYDLGGETSLPNLLRQLGRIGGQFWIRLLYGHPDHVTDDLLAAMAEVQQVCRYLDLPIQHCDEKILRMMDRNGSEKILRALFGRIRSVLPDIALRTTCLVGFPGETDACFQRLLRFIEEIEFDHLGVFVYSEEEGTMAAELSPKISRRAARQRKDALMRCQQKIVGRKLAGLIGKTGEIFVEKQKSNARHVWLARSRYQAPEIDSAVYLRDYASCCEPGMLVRARYIRARGYDLVAETEDNRN